MSRLRQKVRTAVRYFKKIRDFRGVNVLYVVSSAAREESLRWVMRDEFEEYSCRFWTTTVGFLDAEGPLGRVWCDATALDDGHRDESIFAPRKRKALKSRRYRLTELPDVGETTAVISACIGKPLWWERRPGGGEIV